MVTNTTNSATSIENSGGGNGKLSMTPIIHRHHVPHQQQQPNRMPNQSPARMNRRNSQLRYESPASSDDIMSMRTNSLNDIRKNYERVPLMSKGSFRLLGKNYHQELMIRQGGSKRGATTQLQQQQQQQLNANRRQYSNLNKYRQHRVGPKFYLDDNLDDDDDDGGYEVVYDSSKEAHNAGSGGSSSSSGGGNNTNSALTTANTTSTSPSTTSTNQQLQYSPSGLSSNEDQQATNTNNGHQHRQSPIYGSTTKATQQYMGSLANKPISLPATSAPAAAQQSTLSPKEQELLAQLAQLTNPIATSAGANAHALAAA